MKVRKNERGFTLVEIAASTAIGAIALLGTLSAVIMGANVSRSAAETRTAARAAASVMDSVRGASFDTITADWDGAELPLEDFAAAELDGVVAVDVERVDNGSDRWLVHRVEVTARWNGLMGPQTLQFATYVSDRLAVSTAVNGGFDAGAGATGTGQ